MIWIFAKNTLILPLIVIEQLLVLIINLRVAVCTKIGYPNSTALGPSNVLVHGGIDAHHTKGTAVFNQCSTCMMEADVLVNMATICSG